MVNTRRSTKCSKKQTNKRSKPFTVSLRSIKSCGVKVNRNIMDRSSGEIFQIFTQIKLSRKSNKKGGFITSLFTTIAPLWLPTVVNTVKKIVH